MLTPRLAFRYATRSSGIGWASLRSSGLVRRMATTVNKNELYVEDKYEEDELFQQFEQIGAAFATRDFARLEHLVQPPTLSKMIENLNALPRGSRMEWKVLRQDRHSILQCRKVSRMAKTSDIPLEGIQVTVRFVYRRQLVFRDPKGNALDTGEEVQNVEDICVFERIIREGSSSGFKFVAKLSTKVKE